MSKRLLILALCAPILAWAQSTETEYYPSRQTVSLLVGPGLGFADAIRGDAAESGFSGHLDLGASLTVGYDQNELFLIARGSAGRGDASLGLIGGYRGVFGREDWQTFVDLGVAARLFSGVWVGPRVGFGLRHNLSDQVSLLGGLGVALGFGSGLRLDAEAFTGLQWRLPI